MSEPKSDQKDIVAENEGLKADLASANEKFTQAQTKIGALEKTITALESKATELTSGNTNFQAVITERTKERDTLKAENDTLKTKMADFNKSLAAELAKRGIRPEAVPMPPAGSGTASGDGNSASQMTVTEKCMAAKGLSK